MPTIDKIKYGDTIYDIGENGTTNNIYFFEEQVIGTWIDGKPIYRKVIHYNQLIEVDQINIPHNVSNIGTYTNAYGYTRFNEKNYQFGAYANSAAYINIQNIDNQYIVLNCGENWNNLFDNTYIILEYTKTTD